MLSAKYPPLLQNGLQDSPNQRVLAEEHGTLLEPQPALLADSHLADHVNSSLTMTVIGLRNCFSSVDPAVVYPLKYVVEHSVSPDFGDGS